MNSISYDADYHAWTLNTARLLREGRWAEADLEHIAEELESMGASERRELESRLIVLLQHLLKWQYQREKRSSGWLGTLDEQRTQLEILLRQSPSLRRLGPDSLDFAYPKARQKAARETGLDPKAFPAACPYTLEEILDEAFLPDDAPATF
jgi:hypothetical protein